MGRGVSRSLAASATAVAIAALSGLPLLDPVAPIADAQAAEPGVPAVNVWPLLPEDDKVEMLALSANGEHIYLIASEPLNPGDPAFPLSKIYDLHGTTARLIMTAGRTSFRYQWGNADASVIAFTSDRSFVPEDADTADDIYLEGPWGFRLVTTDAEDGADLLAVTPNGSDAIFRSVADFPGAIEAGAPRWDLFRWHAATGAITLLTPDVTDDVTFVAASPGLSRVLFRTTQLLTPGETPIEGGRVFERVGDAYVVRAEGNVVGATADFSKVVFNSDVARDPADGDDTSDGYAWSTADDTYALLTPDTPTVGQVFAFAADGSRWLTITPDPLVTEDVDAESDVYLVEAGSGPTLPSPDSADWSVHASRDLGVLVINTATPLVADDVNGLRDLYRLDLESGGPAELVTNPESSVPGANYEIKMTDDGSRISFRTKVAEFPTDVDNSDDDFVFTAGHLIQVTPGTRDDAEMRVSASLTRFMFRAAEFAQPRTAWVADVYLDASLPTATAPALSVPAGTQMGGSTIDARLTWGAAVSAGTIAKTAIEQQQDGGAWTTLTTAPTARSATVALASGHSYRFRNTATDNDGTESPSATSGAYPIKAFQDTSKRLKLTGSWKSRSGTGYMGGSVGASSSTSARAKLSFTGRAVSIVVTTSRKLGKFDVLVDGKLKGTINTAHGPFGKRTVVYRATWSSAGGHKIEIRPRGGNRIELDAIVVVS